jgi:hypothetical protein
MTSLNSPFGARYCRSHAALLEKKYLHFRNITAIDTRDLIFGSKIASIPLHTARI